MLMKHIFLAYVDGKMIRCRMIGNNNLHLSYYWFSHEVTKIQTKKLTILPRFYFHDALEQLKTNFHTNFRFKRVLGFVKGNA